MKNLFKSLTSNGMTKWSTVFLMLTLSVQIFPSNAQEKLPKCQSTDERIWDACVGIKVSKGEYFYKGGFRNGKMHGFGVYVVIQKHHRGNKYVGEFVDGEKDGIGTYTYANGDLYVGLFRANKRNGKGVFTFKNGERYEGEYKDDKREGYGTYLKSNGEKYAGYWANDQLVKKIEGVNLETTSKNFPKGDRKAERNQINDVDQSSNKKTEISKNQEKALPTQLAPLNLKVEITEPDNSGQVTISVSTGIDTSSLKINGKEEGGKESGVYVIKRVARAGAETEFIIKVSDVYGRQAEKRVTVKRELELASVSQELSPELLPARSPTDSVAIIIGIEKYRSIPNSENSANDAKLFYEYARKLLGVRIDKIKLLLDEKATDIEILKALKSWLPQNVNKDTTAVYIFFSGHGYVSSKNNDLMLLTHNTDMDFVERTSQSQSELFQLLAATNPAKALIFLDSCFSGFSKNGNLLSPNSRPLAIKGPNLYTPKNVSVLSAANSSEISFSDEKIKQGIFSYFLMKGLEGSADINGDRNLSLGELHHYLAKEVSQHAAKLNKTQNPQLIGDPDFTVVDLKGF